MCHFSFFTGMLHVFQLQGMYPRAPFGPSADFAHSILCNLGFPGLKKDSAYRLFRLLMK